MEKIRELITDLQLAGIHLKQGELMCRHTTFSIGGSVALMVFPETEEQVREVYALCKQYSVRPMIMGAGSNILAPDEELDTVMVETKMLMNRVFLREDGSIYAQAGATLARLANFALDQELTGLEFAHGIPGTVGGGIYMNAGAYGGELKDVLVSVRVLTADGTICEIAKEDVGLSYRHSRFMEEDSVILGAAFSLEKGDKTAIKDKMNDLMGRRRTTQPLDRPSAGSTFKRPKEGYAAALIDQCGLKGFSVGGAMVSEKHAGFVVNTGRATAKDVKQLMAEVQRIVKEQTGIQLEPEVRILEVK